MGNKSLREFFEMDEKSPIKEEMTLQQIADKEGITRPGVSKILKKSMEKLYKAIANDEDYKNMDAFQKVIILVKMIEELSGTEVSYEKVLDYLPKDIVNNAKEAGKKRMGK